MLGKAEEDDLPVRGIVADIYDYPIDSSFDFILLDSILHFYKREREMEITFVQRIMHKMRTGAILCIFVSKSKTTEPVLESVFKKASSHWRILEDKYIRYPKMNALYRMFIAEKK
jgi:hypothetical protein